MRIIAGELRGRLIDAPAGQGTRPMLDRVREAVFSTLAERVESARVLDLFAGSGALGIEALSRGAEHVRFVERGMPALEALKHNVETLALRDRCRVIRGDAWSSRSWHDADETDVRYALAFLDPPYPMIDDPNARTKVIDGVHALFARALAPDATIVLHVATRAGETMRFGREIQIEWRTYGSSAIAYLERAAS
jgi:16S rRNA (guanine(966)-N(2))-methyltransferase RsmD